MSPDIIADLAPTGILRAAINLSNFLLVTKTDWTGAPVGVAPDLAHEVANRLGVPVQYVPFKTPGELAGFSEYRRRPGLIAFTHTLIDPRFEGQGLAGRLVQTALSEARSQGLAVLPFCPFVRGYIAEHREEYIDLIPGDLRDSFELVGDA